MFFLVCWLAYLTMCECKIHAGLDVATPLNADLSASYKRSFAYHTVKNRMPVILTQVIDGLTRSKDKLKDEFGEVSQGDLKLVIGELSKLKYEIQTDKSLRLLDSSAPDADFYNEYITNKQDKDGNVTYFSTIWLLSECYMYRRIREAFERTEHLQNYDPFFNQKKESFRIAEPLIINLSQYLINLLSDEGHSPTEDEFRKLLKINLWGNKCDLSLSGGILNKTDQSMFDIETLDPFVLSDHSSKIWSAIANKSAKTIDIVCDNAGYELFTDFCLADYIISTKLATKVRFHVKAIPWFISDVMVKDFHWMLAAARLNPNAIIQTIGYRWSEYVKNEMWTVDENYFWTLPVDFSVMPTVNPALYKKLAEADLVVFKGDLNYRKLFGEKNWDPTTSVEKALQNFHPAPLCTLRTIKADIVCGLQELLAERIAEKDEKWMETGTYGLIQFCDKVINIK